MDISIVVPAYNEEKRIIPTLNEISAYFKARKKNFEIIVVNDGSSDNTQQIIERFCRENRETILLSLEKNSGKGAAVKAGVLHAHGALILFSDSDLSTPIKEFEKLEYALTVGADIAIGSRRMKESIIPVPQPWHRRIAGSLFPLFVRLIALPSFYDTQCGFKLFRASAAKNIFSQLTIEGFAFDVEILKIALCQGWKIREVPITWRNAPGSSVKLIRDSFIMTRDLIKIGFSKK
ncbi:MAG: dolichyl-phosphate beta-glucosyltransferase [Candidatus Ratteibacteria bacterium]|jgi:dolichyl-phosphate beta-glucosyltransferase